MFIQTEADAQSGDPEVPARPQSSMPRHRSICATGRAPRTRRWPSGCSTSPASRGVFFGSDFISVTKSDGDWQQLKPAILGAIMEHFMSGAPLWWRRRSSAADGRARNSSTPKDAETVATIKDLIETRVRPAVANDGGDITFRGYKDGIVYLAYEGRLLGLPVLDRDAASTASRTCCDHFVPDVVEVRAMGGKGRVVSAARARVAVLNLLTWGSICLQSIPRSRPVRRRC